MFENIISNIALGFSVAFSLKYLSYAFLGVLLGNIIGILPGIGALAAISMLLPVTYGLDPIGSLLMLAGLYYGTSFGGATTSILLNLPGTAAHAVTCLDGNPLAKQGKGGNAIFIAMFASFIGVFIGMILMSLFGPLLVEFAFMFGAPEYFVLMTAGLLAASTTARGSYLKGLIGMVLGLFLGTIGTDINSGTERFTAGLPQLAEGISLVAVAMAFFGVNDVLENAGHLRGGVLTGGGLSGRSIRPTREEIRTSAMPIIRGCGLGSFFGILPGTSGGLASFMSYVTEKRISKHPEKFGEGAIEGVAGPEAANSSGSITAFIPTLTLGIPGDAVMALMLGALMIHDITPGPQILAEQPELFWGLIVSFFIGNVMLMLLNIPLIGVWVRLLSVPYRFIYPVVLLLIAVGVYSGNNSLFDVGEVFILGIIAVGYKIIGIDGAPLVLGLVLGPLIEENFRRALVLSRGDVSIFVTRPLSGLFVFATLFTVIFIIYRKYRKRAVTSSVIP